MQISLQVQVQLVAIRDSKAYISCSTTHRKRVINNAMQSITIGNKLEWVHTPWSHLRLQDKSGRKDLQEFPIQPPGERKLISEVLPGFFAALSSLLLEISTDRNCTTSLCNPFHYLNIHWHLRSFLLQNTFVVGELHNDFTFNIDKMN